MTLVDSNIPMCLVGAEHAGIGRILGSNAGFDGYPGIRRVHA